MDGNFGSGIESPVKEGDELDVKIEAVGEKGDGIAKKNGFVLFVAGTKEGDEVRIKVTKVLRRVGFADVVGKAEGKPEQDPSGAQPDEESPQEESPPDTEDFGEDLEESK